MINKKEYVEIHRWISTNYGKANLCTNGCKNKKKYEWALIKGKKYQRNVKNFFQLCTSCHAKYDKRIGGIVKGEKHPRAKLKNRDIKEINILLDRKVKQLIIAKKYKVDPSLISRINTKERWINL